MTKYVQGLIERLYIDRNTAGETSSGGQVLRIFLRQIKTSVAPEMGLELPITREDFAYEFQLAMSAAVNRYEICIWTVDDLNRTKTVTMPNGHTITVPLPNVVAYMGINFYPHPVPD